MYLEYTKTPLCSAVLKTVLQAAFLLVNTINPEKV